MHITTAKLNIGVTYSGSIRLFKPALGWFLLKGLERKIWFEECESVTTAGQRVDINSPIEGETQDEMLRAKKDLDYGREMGWLEYDEFGVEYPYPEKQEWELKYER